MFGIVLLFVITAMHTYVFWRLSSVPLIRRHVPRQALVAAGAALLAVFYLARCFGHGRGGSDVPGVMLELFGMQWMGTVFLAFVPLFALDIVTGFGLVLPRRAPALRGAAACAGALMVAVALVQGLRAPAVVDREVPMPGLPAALDGTVIVALSDTHLGSLLDERWMAARVAQVEALKPDMVVLLGDILEGDGGGTRGGLFPVLRRLSAPMGVWAVLGNHDAYGSHAEKAALLEAAGIRLLRNRRAEVRPGLTVAGVDDLTHRRRSGKKGDVVAAALAGRPDGATILLSHTPWQAEEASRSGADLMLCGHTHGGQIWPFSYLVRQQYPMIGGRYDVGGMTVLVCRGTGTWGPRMRLWRPGEVLRIRLTAPPAPGAGRPVL